MIRAIHICQRDDPATGGAARVAVELVKRLPDHGVSAKCLFVYGPPGAFGNELDGNCGYLGLKSSRHAMPHAGRLPSLLHTEKPDIIHHHDGLIWTHLVSRCIPRTVNYGHAHLDPPARRRAFRDQIAYWLQRQTYDRLVCISQATRHSWIARGFPAERSETIRNGVDTAIFRPATEAERMDARRFFQLPGNVRIVAFVGRLHNEMKGADDFLRVVSLLPEDFHGLVAGSGPDELPLKEFAVELGVDHRVLFAGLQMKPNKCYHAADVLVMTSHYEPFGLVVLEATACGLPVAAFSARGGVMEQLRKVNATVVDQRNCRELADALIRLTASESNTRALRRDYIEKEYSWDSATALLSQSYFRSLHHDL